MIPNSLEWFAAALLGFLYSCYFVLVLLWPFLFQIIIIVLLIQISKKLDRGRNRWL